ncbi:hypothetical protein IDH44_25415 [Paenibacillus sp. IB182496]|uniref:Carbohydrate ABC transporter permease n=1 Tax=Paenibacillus sabuli TaxID=2772509 RepID=A0A927BX71_9BACL|nr:hypothetical protein [Paenibacillus sabuli]MBD2848533.1 hypothetical protein [Paenibacillus sabuli]
MLTGKKKRSYRWFQPGEGVLSRLFDVVNVILMLLLTVIMLYPFVYVTAASLSQPAMLASGAVSWWPKGFTTLAYQRVAEDPFIWLSYWNTIKYTLLQTLFGLLVHNSLNSRSHLRY